MVEDARCTSARACVGISTKGLTKTVTWRAGWRNTDSFRMNVGWDCVCYFVVGHLPPLAVAVRVTRSRLFEEHTRDVKLNCETKLFAFIYATYVGRSCAKEEAAKFRVANNFSVRFVDREEEKLDETRIGNPLLSRDLIEEMILSEEVIFRGRVFFFLGIKMIKSS